MARWVIDPGRKHTIIISLNEYSNEQNSHDLFLDPQTNGSLNTHQRSFYLQ